MPTRRGTDFGIELNGTINNYAEMNILNKNTSTAALGQINLNGEINNIQGSVFSDTTPVAKNLLTIQNDAQGGIILAADKVLWQKSGLNIVNTGAGKH
jgi:hypothetical protein